MEVLQLGNCENEIENEASPPKKPRPHLNIGAHTVDPSSSVIIKSGILSKKGLGFTGNKYKSRLFELTANGELIYYELNSNGQKTKKGEIMITSTTRIEKRSGGTRREAKFIIHTKNRKWYLWCNHIQQIQEKQKYIKKPCITLRPSNAIYKFKGNESNKSNKSNKSKLSISTTRHSQNSISLTNDRSKTLYPYPYLSNSNKSLNSWSNISLLSPTSDTLSTSLSVQTPQTLDNQSPLTLSKESLEYTSPKTSNEAVVVQRNGKEEAMEWVDVLNNMIEGKKRKECIFRERQFDDYFIDDEEEQSKSKKDSFDFEVVTRPRSNSCPLRNYRTDEYVDNDTNYDPNDIWTLKESYLWSKGGGYYSKQYTRKYFVLRLNGKLDWYLDKTMIDKKGSIDILNSCINIEKRKGSDKNNCKLIIFTRRRNYYFWCKEDKKLSDEWYNMIRLIITDKIQSYNNKIEMNVNYRKNSSAHNSLCDTKFDEYEEDEMYCYDNGDDDDEDEFIPQLFCPDDYHNYSSILMDQMNVKNDGEIDNIKHGEIELTEDAVNDDVNGMNLKNIKQIHKWLPLSYRCYDWQLLYSSEIDGYSMLTFYEKCSDLGPTILIIKDENDYIFGVFLSDSMCLDNKLFFGNGETFVFNIYPNLKKFHWKGLNRFFIHCKKNTLTFGGGDNGHSALVLTENFRYGISQKSQTFQNDILSKNIDFSPCLIEVWTFKNYW